MTEIQAKTDDELGVLASFHTFLRSFGSNRGERLLKWTIQNQVVMKHHPHGLNCQRLREECRSGDEEEIAFSNKLSRLWTLEELTLDDECRYELEKAKNSFKKCSLAVKQLEWVV